MAGREAFDPRPLIRAEQGHAGAFSTGDRADGERGHVREHVGQPLAVGHEGGELTETALQVGVVGVRLQPAQRQSRTGN